LGVEDATLLGGEDASISEGGDDIKIIIQEGITEADITEGGIIEEDLTKETTIANKK